LHIEKKSSFVNTSLNFLIGLQLYQERLLWLLLFYMSGIIANLVRGGIGENSRRSLRERLVVIHMLLLLLSLGWLCRVLLLRLSLGLLLRRVLGEMLLLDRWHMCILMYWRCESWRGGWESGSRALR
jgi:hypothetical protein